MLDIGKRAQKALAHIQAGMYGVASRPLFIGFPHTKDYAIVFGYGPDSAVANERYFDTSLWHQDMRDAVPKLFGLKWDEYEFLSRAQPIKVTAAKPKRETYAVRVLPGQIVFSYNPRTVELEIYRATLEEPEGPRVAARKAARKLEIAEERRVGKDPRWRARSKERRAPAAGAPAKKRRS